MTVKKIRRLGAAVLTATVLAAGGAVLAPPAPANAAYICTFERSTPKLRYGSSGSAVTYLQCVLRDVGINVVVDGKFGRGTLNAVKYWQARHPYLGAVDGVVGPKTWKSLLAGSRNY